ncbi:MAG: hypothetical protein JWP34_5070 [Massilia sp.]|nr:hypothetical protein [Massilia sp.]
MGRSEFVGGQRKTQGTCADLKWMSPFNVVDDFDLKAEAKWGRCQPWRCVGLLTTRTSRRDVEEDHDDSSNLHRCKQAISMQTKFQHYHKYADLHRLATLASCRHAICTSVFVYHQHKTTFQLPKVGNSDFSSAVARNTPN